MVLVLSVYLHTLVVCVRPHELAYATLVVDGQDRSVVAHGPIGKLGDRCYGVVRVLAAQKVEAMVVDGSTLVRDNAQFQPPVRRRVVVCHGLEAVHAEVGEVESRPVYAVLAFQSDGIHQFGVVYMSSTRPLGAYVGVASLVDIECEGEVEVYLLLLEGVAGLESQLQGLAFVEEVGASDVELIRQSAARTVAERQRIEHRTDAEVALLVRAELASGAHHEAASYVLPEQFGPHTGLAALGGGVGLPGVACCVVAAVEILLVAVCGYGAYEVEQRRVAAVDDLYRVGQLLGQVVHRCVFGGDVVAEEEKSGVEVALCRHECLDALVARGHRYMEAHEVVLAVKRSFEYPARRFLYTCPSAHQFGVLEARPEAYDYGSAHKRTDLVAVETAVAHVERRYDSSVDEQFFVDERSEIFQHGWHCSHAVRYGVALEHLRKVHVARTFHHHAVVGFAHMFAHSGVCNGIHRRNGEQQTVAAVGTYVVLQICIALLSFQSYGVDRGCIAEHTLHNLKRVLAVGGVGTGASSHRQHYSEQYV